MMDTPNIRVFKLAIHAMDAADIHEIEREFDERYQSAVASSGFEYTEALAKSEALYVLLQLDAEVVEYLRPHLR